MIPNIIHYCWFGGKKLPLDVRKCIKSWERNCPDYKIKQWDESNFDINCHPFVKAAYESKAWAFVSDYARLKIVYENGGIYLDTDVELLKNIDCLRHNEFYIGVQQCGHLCTTGLGFGATKNNIVVQQMLKQYDQICFNEEEKELIACPYLNNKVLEDIGYMYNNEQVRIENILILPPKYLDPISPGIDVQNLLCEETISIHHYAASWTSKRTKMKRKLIRILGEKRYHMIKKIFHRVK